MRMIGKVARVASVALISGAAMELARRERAIGGEPMADPRPGSNRHDIVRFLSHFACVPPVGRRGTDCPQG